MKIAIIGCRKLDEYRKKVIEKIIEKDWEVVTINIGETNKYIINYCNKNKINLEMVEIERTIGEANLKISEKAEMLIVVSGGENSGTILVAKNFLDLGKEVLAVPGRIDDELSWAPNFLIKNGAGVLTGVL